MPEYREVLFSIAKSPELRGQIDSELILRAYIDIGTLIKHVSILLILYSAIYILDEEFNPELFEIVKSVQDGTIGFPVRKEFFFASSGRARMLDVAANSNDLIESIFSVLPPELSLYGKSPLLSDYDLNYESDASGDLDEAPLGGPAAVIVEHNPLYQGNNNNHLHIGVPAPNNNLPKYVPYTKEQREQALNAKTLCSFDEPQIESTKKCSAFIELLDTTKVATEDDFDTQEMGYVCQNVKNVKSVTLIFCRADLRKRLYQICRA